MSGDSVIGQDRNFRGRLAGASDLLLCWLPLATLQVARNRRLLLISGFGVALRQSCTGNFRIKPRLLLELRPVNLVDGFPFRLGNRPDAIARGVSVVFAAVPPFGGIAPICVRTDGQVISNTIDDYDSQATGAHRGGQCFESAGVVRLSSQSFRHEFINEPINRSNSPAEDQDKELAVMCCMPINSRADFPTRTNPGTSNAQPTVCKARNRRRQVDLFWADIHIF